ncbi:RtcB family protein [Desulfurispora thermophila]|uniref:RtcB family protein n=1 Tax=Desulfurispora thermophila TaxID=265470 RepID=UPI0003642DD8|nr:RtcB family protein [Desulfurispora thermophila]
MELTKISPYKYVLERRGDMRVNAVVYLSPRLLPLVYKDASLKQLADAACLPGVLEPVCGMPDIHEGFGLPIGGVMATRPDGVISAGAVGMDINCGVRLLSTRIPAADLDKPVLRRLIQRIEEYVPTGTGKKSRHKGITEKIFQEVVYTGAPGIVRHGYGRPADLRHIEEGGCLPGANLSATSPQARSRGAVQLGTLGGGNHFIELQAVEEIFDPVTAASFGLPKGTLAVMIHTGSRGFGHQICTDYSRDLLPAGQKYGIQLPAKGLACAPAQSPEGQRYYAAMACAVNFAFANRQVITHDVRAAFRDVLAEQEEKMGLDLVYDVAHNIAKWETHAGRQVLVHRKGATRALPPGHSQNPPAYRKTGHPVLLPGSMGTASYVLVGTEKAAETFYSVSHGAGRVLSRTAAGQQISAQRFAESMGEVLLSSRNYRELVDEAPDAYKDIDLVVETLVASGLARPVARLRPLAVIKGKD